MIYICALLLLMTMFNYNLHCAGPTLNGSVESSTSTSISLKWTGADDRVNYYSTIEMYYVWYFKPDGVEYEVRTARKSVTVLALEPDTEYTFFLQAATARDYALGPTKNLTSRTQKQGESYDIRRHYDTMDNSVYVWNTVI